MTEHPRLDSIGKRYEIRSCVGEGGMGTVYKAHDSLLEKEVAIKKLHETNKPDAAVRFQNEAELQKFSKTKSIKSLILLRVPKVSITGVESLRKRIGNRFVINYADRGAQEK